MEIRTAKQSDVGDIAAQIYSAGTELYDFIYQTRKQAAIDFIGFEFQSGYGFCGYRNLTVAVMDGKVVGTGCFYDGKGYGLLKLGTVVNMFRFYGWLAVWPVLLRSRHIGSVMKKPEKGEWYLANFAVERSRQGQGIGTQLIQSQWHFAAANGYKTFALDVADNNPKAEKLYTRLGLRVVCEKVFSGKRQEIVVPKLKKMVMALAVADM